MKRTVSFRASTDAIIWSSLTPMCSFSKKHTHIQSALLMAVLRTEVILFFNQICSLITSLSDGNYWPK